MAILRRGAVLVAAGVFTLLVMPALAWDAVGHRAICWLAMDGLDKDAPAFLREPVARHAVGWQAAEPDRWRSVHTRYMSHENDMDHYMDIEELADFGLTLGTVPPLRYQFVSIMAVQRHVHPEGLSKPYDASRDPNGTGEWPGFVPHAIMEHHSKLIAAFKTFRILTKLNEPARAPQLEMAKANIMVEMGVLAHFVGDAAQPLHTTKHHHGWVGGNPNGFTTDRTIHATIDGGIIKLNAIEYHTLKPTQTYERTINADDPWQDVLAHLQRSHDKVQEVYELEKSGELRKAAGKAFIEERLHDGASMLAALYNAAWRRSEPSPKEVRDFVGYDGFDVKQVP